MDMKNKEFIERIIFSSKTSNMISLISVITIFICLVKLAQVFLSLHFNDVYNTYFRLIIYPVAFIACLSAYSIISSMLILDGESRFFKRLHGIFSWRNKVDKVKSAVDDVGLLILNEMDSKGYSLIPLERGRLSGDEIVEAKCLSSALYITGLISDRISSINDFNYRASLYLIPELVLINAVKFCDFDFMSMSFAGDEGKGTCLIISCGSGREVFIRGDGVDRLAKEILSMGSFFPNSEFTFIKNDLTNDEGNKTAKIIIGSKSILMKIG